MDFLIDPDDAKNGPPTGPEPLRDLIVAQGAQETGIFVLLFSTATAAEAVDVSEQHTQATELVERKAAELGVDLAGLALFSDEAYLLQATLGEAAVPDPR